VRTDITPEVRRELDDLRAGRVRTVREFSLDVAPATSTTFQDRLCSSSSVVIPVPYSADAIPEAIRRVVPGNAEFTVHHTSSANTRTYRYTVQTGNAL